ncbi:deoxycytidine deaminase [Spongiactinospora gelatinilytica]|uniref:Deoxycytidine deaminase n=1 Tax=Spongiactinospora gelatinilytica TaxID=2666298 RepID=A0A2W2GTL5_9ACTN|nr:deoxycytidine deaminase [Spongiactinospora gelatinilytica]PZG45879.1 deoxycytidine deaminase [Spongiactinospora gelatinilytica]
MILTGPAIAAELQRDRITIDPFDPALLNPNSVNYRLGPALRVHRSAVIDPLADHPTDEIIIPAGGIVLQPRRIYLGTTLERIGSAYYVPSLIGRSSLSRLGVFLQISADLGNLGAVHRWTLEIVAVQPIRLYTGMIVGQISFWVPHGVVPSYDGHFGRFSTAVTPPPRLLTTA